MNEDFCKYYDFSIESICSAARRRGARRILLQLPEGFLRCSSYIVDELERVCGDVEAVVSSNPAYGSCLVDEQGFRQVNADLLVHVGHVEYPLYNPRVPTLFIPAEYVGSVRLSVENIASELDRMHAKTVEVYSTAQHISLASRIAEALRGLHIDALYRGVVTGCLPPRISSDAAIVVAGGLFHALGLGLRNYERADSILAADPYTGQVRSIGSEVRRVLRIRYWKISLSANAKNWVLINGFYGQWRRSLERTLCDLLRRSGRRCIRVVSYAVTRQTLENMDSDSVDAFVVLSCPRIAIDDLYDYGKPVLTPGELLMVLKGLERYVYPW